MKKSPKILHWLDTGIFPATVLFIHRFTYEETLVHLKKKKAQDWMLGLHYHEKLIKSDSWAMLGLFTEIENKKDKSIKRLFYIIIRDPFKFTDYEYCKLAHEVLHICQFMLPDILDRNKEHEAECYLHTHLMKQCLKALRGE